MVTIVFQAHTGFSVTTDSKAKIFAFRWANCLRNVRLVGETHIGVRG
jgi:hypothetical protein